MLSLVLEALSLLPVLALLSVPLGFGGSDLSLPQTEPEPLRGSPREVPQHHENTRSHSWAAGALS